MMKIMVIFILHLESQCSVPQSSFPFCHGSLWVTLYQSHSSQDCNKDKMGKENNLIHFGSSWGQKVWV